MQEMLPSHKIKIAAVKMYQMEDRYAVTLFMLTARQELTSDV